MLSTLEIINFSIIITYLIKYLLFLGYHCTYTQWSTSVFVIWRRYTGTHDWTIHNTAYSIKFIHQQATSLNLKFIIDIVITTLWCDDQMQCVDTIIKWNASAVPIVYNTVKFSGPINLEKTYRPLNSYASSID